MAEDLTIIKTATKAEQYQSLIPQIEALLAGETDFVANMANVAAALKEQFNWFWVGFYLVKNGELVLKFTNKQKWKIKAKPLEWKKLPALQDKIHITVYEIK